MQEAIELFEIIKCFLYRKEYVPKKKIDEVKLYNLAAQNSVSSFLYDWAKKCESQEVKQAIINDFNRQIIRDTNFNLEAKNIFEQFEKNKIDTVLVKGITMKEIYPQDYIRPMCDIDLLVHSEDVDRVSEMMKEMKYNKEEDIQRHLSFEKKPFFLVEVHRNLVSETEVFFEYFKNIWTQVVKYQDYQHVYRLAINDTYLFCIIHLYLHFKYAGNDIKDMLDVYLINEKYKNEFDFEKIHQKLEEFGIAEFEKNIKQIAYKWFSDEVIEDFDSVEKYILKGESLSNFYHFSVLEKKGKKAYFVARFFPGLQEMKRKFLVLEKLPFLLPIMWCVRIVKGIFSRYHTWGDRAEVAKMVKNTSKEELEEIKMVYQKLGIIRKD